MIGSKWLTYIPIFETNQFKIENSLFLRALITIYFSSEGLKWRIQGDQCIILFKIEDQYCYLLTDLIQIFGLCSLETSDYMVIYIWKCSK